jgi:hypothetical protein
MRLNDISGTMTRALFGKFTPTMRLDVYDQFQERMGRGKVKVAEVLSDGTQGERPIFTHKRTAFTSGGMGPDGIARDGAVQTLAPYRQATLEHAMKSELPGHNLRAELVRLG